MSLTVARSELVRNVLTHASVILLTYVFNLIAYG